MEDVQELGLVKGVLMVEGALKSPSTNDDGKEVPTVMTAENVMQAGGALRAAAIMGFAGVDIDHFEEELPEKYVKKYGKEINDPYPVGFVIDAEVVKNSDGLMEVQAIMAIYNPLVFKLVKEGKIKGNSVVDYYRKLTCDSDACNYEGSSYLYNTLVLEEVPNSNSTWVNAVDEEDLEKWIEHKHSAKRAAQAGMKRELTRLEKIHNARSAKHAVVKGHNLENYLTDGIWNDGKDGVIEYLKEEKGLDEATATALGEYMFNNPEMFNDYQIEHLSGADLIAWWTHVKLESQEDAMRIMANNLNLMMAANPQVKSRTIQHACGLKKKNNNAKTAKPKKATLSYLMSRSNIIKFGQGEVDYGEAMEGEQCKNCRYVMLANYEDPDGSGECAIVADEIRGNGGCSKFEPNPTMPDEPADEDPEEEGGEPEQPQPDEPMDDQTTGGQSAPVPKFEPQVVKRTHAAKTNPHTDEINALTAKIDQLTLQHNAIQIPWGRAKSEQAIKERQALKSEIYNLRMTLENDYDIIYEIDLN